MNKSNLRIQILLLVLTVLNSCENPKTNKVGQNEQYSLMVGDILFDSKLDSSVSSFQTCREYYSNQYYNYESNGLKYKGEKPQLVKEIMKNFIAPKDSSENGYLTVRFVVNCKGESGYYRVKQLDNNYLAKKFSDELVSSLSQSVSKLNGWQVKGSKSSPKDYHQYLTFRIVNSQIKSIVP